MWISRRRYEILMDRSNQIARDMDMMLRKMAELYTEHEKCAVRLNQLERSVYGKPVTDGKKTLHG